jgi:hypothetical protein
MKEVKRVNMVSYFLYMYEDGTLKPVEITKRMVLR